MNVEAYLDRIAFDRSTGGGPPAPSPETLRALQVAHLTTVPFENLSIQGSRPIVLAVDALFEKVVARRRGGFCYELNGLFAALLRALGFDVALLSAEVARADGTFSPAYDHMALLVTLEERWLVDVGFGETFREPLRLDTREEQIQGDWTYRIDAEETGDGRFLLLQRQKGEPWEPQYRFLSMAHELEEFEPRCLYHQTSPESHFTQKRVCSLALPDGRVTLSGQRLIATRGGLREERELAGEEEVTVVLRERFGVVV